MSDLKYQTVDQLLKTKQDCEKYISNLKATLGGQQKRLNWIDKCLYEKDPQEMSIAQIEEVLSLKVILK